MLGFWLFIAFAVFAIAVSGYSSFLAWLLPERLLAYLRHWSQNTWRWPKSDDAYLALARILHPLFFIVLLILLVFIMKDPAEYGFK